MKYWGVILLSVFNIYCFAQFTIAEGAEIAASAGAEMVIVADGDITNNSTFDFAPLDLRLSIIADFSDINGNWTFSQLTMDGGIVSMNGNISITNAMAFNNGVLQVPDNFKLLFTGPGENVSFTEESPGDSYIDGTFYQRGTGRRIFPVGDGEMPLPLTFLDVKTETEVGVQAFAEDAMISPQLDILEVDNTRYWSIISDNVASIQSPVKLYKAGVLFSIQEGMVVVEADPSVRQAKSLLGGDGDDFYVTSASNVTQQWVAIGRSEKVDPKIHDLITPYDGSGGSISGNDAIYIENLFPENRVILMDRWGVKIKEWKNYRNNDPNEMAFFQTLTPGNYICVVETVSNMGMLSASQMVTVLKTN